MTLNDVIQALELKGILVANNIGEHGNCDISSNCPKAIEVRKIINESGLTLAAILEAVQEIQSLDAPSKQITVDALPEINCMAEVHIGDQTVQVDMTSMVEAATRTAIHNKLDELNNLKTKMLNTIMGCNKALNDQIVGLKRKKDTPPQLSFTLESILNSKAMCTSIEGNYVIIFPLRYHPEYIYKDGGRFRITDPEVLTRDVYLTYTISTINKILKTELHNKDGSKFSHYHGNNEYDCWGNIKMPTVWDGKLESLWILTTQLEKSLVTINYNSMMNSGRPIGLPTAESLLESAVKLGIEGQRTIPTVPVFDPITTARVTATDNRPVTTGWGRH
jgi:hypothetical protein